MTIILIRYYSATNRDVKGLGKIPELQREDLKRIQEELINAMKSAKIDV